MQRIRPALGVIVLNCLLLVGCLHSHRATGQNRQDAKGGSGKSGPVPQLKWEQGLGLSNDPPPDCASAPRAPSGSKSDGAVKGGAPSTAAYPIENALVAKDYEISAKSLADFEGLVYYAVLPAHYTLYRVIGKDSNPLGEWWTGYLPPHGKAEWRSDLAVLAEWNGASCLVKYEVGADGIKAWVGKAAPQPDGAAGWYLKGGGWQVFVPEPAEQITKDTLRYAPIPWTQ